MGLWDRFARRRGPRADGPRDDVLPALSTEQARELVRLARQVLAELGAEAVHLDGGGLRLADGQVYGLHNVSVQAAGAPFTQWPELLREHFSRMLAVSQQDEQAVVAPEQVFLRLRNADDLRGLQPPLGYPAQEVLPGILALVSIDHPTHVTELTQDLGPTGLDLAGAAELGLRNLRGLPEPAATTVLAQEDDPTSAVHLLVSEDLFGASRLLVLDEVLQAALAHQLGELGAFVVVPHRHLLGVHLPMTAAGTLAALSLLTQVGMGEHADAPGPVSPFVFHVDRSGEGRQVVFAGEDGTPQLRPDGRVVEVLEALGLFGQG